MKKYSITSKYTAAVPRSQRRKNVESRGVVAGYSAGGGSGVDRSYVDANFVTLATEQTVPARKDFAAGISMYGIPWEYDVERDVWTIKGNVIITKGLATYSSLKEDDVLSVFDGLPIDNNTLQWQETGNGKILVAVGGGSGGGLDESKLQDYLDEKKYVTESWVTGKNYALKTDLDTVSTKLNNFLEGSDTNSIIDKWSELEVFLSGLAETDNLATILSGKANKSTTLAGYGITNAYTKTEVQDNFLALTGGQLSGNLEVYKSTAYIWANNNGANSIGLRAGYDVGLRHRNSSNVEQWALAVANSGNGMWTRFPLAVNMSVDEPRSAYSLYVNGDSYTTGTFYLNGAPLTYNSSKNAWQLEGNLIVTGGLATYTKLSGFTNLDVMGGIVVDNTTIAIVDGALKYIGETSGGGSVSITGAASTIVSSNLTASRALISNSSGKVAVSSITSTKLGYLTDVTSNIQAQLNNKQATLVSGTNIKTINGTSILGSGNIAISGGASGDYLPIDGGTLEGRLFLASSATQGFSLAQLVLGPSQYARISSNDNGNFYIYGRQITLRPSSTTSASSLGAVIDTAGNMNVTGAVTENSDRKLKNIEYEGDGLDLDALKKVKVAKWHWKDKRDKRQHIGGVADNLAEVMPEVVFESEEEDGTTTSSIAYGKAGFSIAASLIAPVARHEDRIKELEKNIEKMQKELNQLRKTA